MTDASDLVLIDKPRPHTAVITLNRPERMNSMAFACHATATAAAITSHLQSRSTGEEGSKILRTG